MYVCMRMSCSSLSASWACKASRRGVSLKKIKVLAGRFTFYTMTFCGDHGRELLHPSNRKHWKHKLIR